MRYKRKPLVIEAVPLTRELAEKLGHMEDGHISYLVTLPNGEQTVMTESALCADFIPARKVRQKTTRINKKAARPASGHATEGPSVVSATVSPLPVEAA